MKYRAGCGVNRPHGKAQGGVKSMEGRQKKDTTTQFLVFSFVGLLIFSIVIFSILGIYMSRKSKKAVYEMSEIYMSGMNEQMSRHFETVIKLRFAQVSGIVSVVSTEINDKETLYEELIYLSLIHILSHLSSNENVCAMSLSACARICFASSRQFSAIWAVTRSFSYQAA